MKTTKLLPRKHSEQQLYDLLKKNDPLALKHIHSRYHRLLCWLGNQFLQDDFVVDTLVQDAFLKLWLHRDAIETPKHMIGFLRFVLKRDCISYLNAPKNKFNRLMNSLERFDNYQNYLAGYDPEHDHEHLLRQECDQKNADEVKKFICVLDPKRKHLIELCLQYGFRHKAIAEAMGSSTVRISREVQKTIEELRNILTANTAGNIGATSENKKVPATLSSRQLDIARRRFEQKSSFATIARDLNLSEKEVHREFLFAYRHLHQNKSSLKLY